MSLAGRTDQRRPSFVRLDVQRLMEWFLDHGMAHSDVQALLLFAEVPPLRVVDHDGPPSDTPPAAA